MPEFPPTAPPTASAGPQRRNALGLTTRDRLVVTAERLFAERGIAAVSLREIAQAARQRNNTALQYHFGTRAGLLDAIHATRAAALNARRLELLDAVGRDASVEQLVEVMIRPYAESVADPASHYVALLSRLLSERGALENITSLEAVGDHLAARNHVAEQLFELQPEVSPEVVTRRLHQVLAWAIVAFAALAPSNGASRIDEATDLLADLTPMLSAALTAPTLSAAGRRPR